MKLYVFDKHKMSCTDSGFSIYVRCVRAICAYVWTQLRCGERCVCTHVRCVVQYACTSVRCGGRCAHTHVHCELWMVLTRQFYTFRGIWCLMFVPVHGTSVWRGHTAISMHNEWNLRQGFSKNRLDFKKAKVLYIIDHPSIDHTNVQTVHEQCTHWSCTSTVHSFVLTSWQNWPQNDKNWVQNPKTEHKMMYSVGVRLGCTMMVTCTSEIHVCWLHCTYGSSQQEATTKHPLAQFNFSMQVIVKFAIEHKDKDQSPRTRIILQHFIYSLQRTVYSNTIHCKT